ncbi:snaclec A11-like [Mercenaria mercenaria]|uniref:snaclec A11-like n=1 Tax=Mercenaria mercenaria TaxID=6596 RepID=UPI00234E8B94|nr:snaclec A11-like [Mercenaria mercenaria]XP_053382712.1 snaclec A11-like [Mercenaria mercenaria]
MKLTLYFAVICLAYSTSFIKGPAIVTNAKPSFHGGCVSDEECQAGRICKRLVFQESERSLKQCIPEIVPNPRSASSDENGESDDEAVAPCPPGWILNKDSCYFFSETVLLWIEANDACRTLAAGGGLVEVHDEAEQNFLEMTLNQPYDFNDYWSALNDIDEEGQFNSVNSRKNASFTNFQQGTNSEYRNCVALTFGYLNYWIVTDCYQYFRYICEIGVLS